MDTWKDIPGYEGLYEITSNGIVRSKSRRKYNGKGFYTLPGRVLSVYYKSNHGYPVVQLSDIEGNKNRFTLHRLVALAHIPNPNNLPVVLHKDDNKLNCSVNNLSWGTQRQNLIDAFKTGINKGNRTKGKENIQSMQIAQCDSNGNTIKIWDAIKDAQREGYSAGNIVLVAKGKRNHHKGFIWKYV